MPYHDQSLRDRFRIAVETLATGTVSLQQRLNDAFALQLVCLRSEDLPDDLRELFGSIVVYLTRREAVGNEGDVQATTDALPIEHAQQIAKAIVEMSYKLEDWPDE